MLGQYLPGSWRHESIWWRNSVSGESAHFCAGDELEIIFTAGIEEIHGFLDFVIGCHLEGYDLKSVETGGLDREKGSLVAFQHQHMTMRSIYDIYSH